MDRLVARAFRPIGIAFLVYFRVLFGVLNLVLLWLYWDLGLIERFYVEPIVHFTYYGFDWVRPWPGNGMYWHYAALAALSVLVTLGLFYRVAVALLCLGLAHVFLIEQARFLNHYYLNVLVAFLLIFLPAHRAFSLDARWRPGLRAATAPAWTLWLLQFQVGIVYFFAGIAKLNWDWLTGLVVKPRLATSTHLPLVGPWLAHDPVALAMSWAGLLFDLLVVPMLLWRRTRWLALAGAVAFHGMNAVLFDIDIFPFFMLGATYILFFPDRLPFARRIEGAGGSAAQARGRRLTVAALAVYAAVQLAVPLRHHLYPGDPNWTEEGHYFSWRMLMRAKTGVVRDMVATYRNPRGELVSARFELPDDQEFWTRHWQFERMARTPDMILQFVHWEAEKLRAAGNTEIDIRADVVASLNGRPWQLLIDPRVNLAAQPRAGFAHADWILPLETERPTLRELGERFESPAAADR